MMVLIVYLTCRRDASTPKEFLRIAQRSERCGAVNVAGAPPELLGSASIACLTLIGHTPMLLTYNQSHGRRHRAAQAAMQTNTSPSQTKVLTQPCNTHHYNKKPGLQRRDHKLTHPSTLPQDGPATEQSDAACDELCDPIRDNHHHRLRTQTMWSPRQRSAQRQRARRACQAPSSPRRQNPNHLAGDRHDRAYRCPRQYNTRVCRWSYKRHPLRDSESRCASERCGKR
jgi:hypothetical protein